MESRKFDDEYQNLQKKVNGNKSPKKHYVEPDDGEEVVSWIGNVTNLIHTYGIKKVLQAILLIVSLISFLMFANALDNQDIIEHFIEDAYKSHTMGFNIRNDVNPKVNTEILKLLYESGADRVSVLEMHNGKENPTSLPFKYCEMTYEQTRDGIPYISEEYSNLNMSKYMFANYVYQKKIFLGDVSDIRDIDKKLEMMLSLNDVKCFGVILLNTNVEIGFLVVSYNNEPEISKEELTSKLIRSSQIISNLLDYTKQVELKNNKNTICK